MKRIATLTTLTLVAAFFVASASAESIVLGATKDTYVHSGTPSSNFGLMDTIMLGQEDVAGRGTIRGLLHFDLTSLPSNPDLIQSAVFRAYQYGQRPAGGGKDCYIHRCTSSWTETGATWYTQPTQSGEQWAVAEVGDTYESAPVYWVEWDVTELVRAQASGQYPNYGWSFRVEYETYGTCRIGYFHSNEYLGNPELRPQLEVQYSTVVPEPAAMSLLTLGGLLVLRRR